MEAGSAGRILSYNDLSDRPIVDKGSDDEFDEEIAERKRQEEDERQNAEEEMRMEEERLQLEAEKEKRKQEELEDERVGQ